MKKWEFSAKDTIYILLIVFFGFLSTGVDLTVIGVNGIDFLKIWLTIIQISLTAIIIIVAVNLTWVLKTLEEHGDLLRKNDTMDQQENNSNGKENGEERA